MKPLLPFRVVVPAALAALALLSGPAGAQSAAPAPTTAEPPSNYTPTRAEVERDLAAWKESGVEALWAGEDSPDINSPTYINDYQKYISAVRSGNMGQPPANQTGSQRRW